MGPVGIFSSRAVVNNACFETIFIGSGPIKCVFIPYTTNGENRRKMRTLLIHSKISFEILFGANVLINLYSCNFQVNR